MGVCQALPTVRPFGGIPQDRVHRRARYVLAGRAVTSFSSLARTERRGPILLRFRSCRRSLNGAPLRLRNFSGNPAVPSPGPRARSLKLLSGARVAEFNYRHQNVKAFSWRSRLSRLFRPSRGLARARAHGRSLLPATDTWKVLPKAPATLPPYRHRIAYCTPGEKPSSPYPAVDSFSFRGNRGPILAARYVSAGFRSGVASKSRATPAYDRI